MPKKHPVTLLSRSGRVIKCPSMKQAAQFLSRENNQIIHQANLKHYLDSSRYFMGYNIRTSNKQVV